MKTNISGMSLPNRITFAGNKYSIDIETKTGKYSLSQGGIKTVTSLWDILFKIPFIRGFCLFPMTLIKMILSSTPYMKVLFLIVFLMLFLPPHQGPPPSNPVTASILTTFANVFFISLNLLIVGFFGWVLLNVRPNHGLEHKMIGTYEKGKRLTIKNIRSTKKEHPRCGGTILAWIWIFMIPFKLLGFNMGLFNILFLSSFAYECAILARRDSFVGRIFFAPGWLVQQATTSDKIDETTIKRVSKPFKLLLKLEEKQ